EVGERCTSVPIVLVRLKKELWRSLVAIEELHKPQNFVNHKNASEGTHSIKIKKHLEFPCLTGGGVDYVSEAATRAMMPQYDDKTLVDVMSCYNITTS
ncbi:hypothetical protein BGZ60DRAFT_385714, partial [Tricladium varicosporioides]